ncbi:MAG: DNRLRE domain-containing protein [Planctomycetota bacterium]
MDNAAPTPQSSAASDVPVALAKPFYPRALICFIVSTLCLAWLVSLQVQSARHASIVIAPQNEVAPPKPVEPVVETPVESKSSAPARDVTDADFAIAEIELLHKLVLEDPSLNLKKTSNVIRTYTYSTNEAVRAAAIRELSQVNTLHDRAALKSISDALTPAQALADKKDFAGALELLQATLKSLPKDPAGSGQSAENRLRDLIAEYGRERVKEHEAALGGLEAELRKKAQGAEARLTQALAHVDPAVRDDAKAIQQRHLESNDKDLQNKRSLERTAREEWVRFFKRFGGAVSDGDFTGASDLIEQPPFEAILKGGVSDPEKVLRRCAEDIKAIQNVYEEALKDVKGMRRAVSFHLRKGGQASGMLIGANGHLLRVVPGKGAEIGVKISDLNSEGVKSIMDSGLKNKPSIQLALAAMEAYETPADAESIITAAYEKAREPMPLNWSERFKIEKLMLKITAAEVKLKALEKAVKADNGDEIKAALTEAKAVVAELNEAGALSDENRELLSKAEASSAKKALATVVLQNGKLPDPTYRGFNTDQISDYRDALRRTDVGIGYGLRLGADGGLKRVLLKFDGLDVAVGNGRVRRATLQFYQIDSPKFDGASIGVFRVKRPWVPDSGSWISYDGQKDHDWTIPGASGEADIEPREDAKVLIDGKTNKWVSWDITKYVQDVIAGKVQNNGLLIKVVNGEPEYHVRFYPESDLDRNKDISLRPKLVLDIGWDLE